MTEARFIEKNEEQWQALEDYNKLLNSLRGRGKMSAEHMREFARLFRLASHHLAYAKTHYPKGRALPYLNRVVGVSHNYFYVREGGKISDIWRYFSRTFPKAVCGSWGFSAVAAVIFALGLVFGGIYVAEQPDMLQTIMPFDIAVGNAGEDIGDIWDGGYIQWDHSFMSAVIMTNNIAVAFNAFASGLLAGLGTVFILVYNGLIVGALFGFLHMGGADMLIAYSLILPHGVLELAAIFICGGCGLMLGKGMLMPGEYTRRHSLILHAKKAAVLIPGVVVMLVIAALIEGFFTPLPISPEMKIAFAVLTGVLFLGYIYNGKR